MRFIIWTRGEHFKNLGLAVCEYICSQNSRHASQFALLWLVHRLTYNGDVVAFKMGRRQGARRAHI
jgi:hypothetical protein